MATELIKPGYKRTEIGVIPIDWDIDEIQNHAKITTGSKNTQDRIEGGRFPFYVRSQKIERINTYSFDGEAILTAGDGVGTGKVFHYIKGKFDFHQRVYLISNFDNKLDGYFFYLYFSKYFLGRIMSMTAKSSVDSVRRDMIAKMLIPLPTDKNEQVKIGEIIKDTVMLIENLDKLIEKKKNIKQGTMHELLNGKKRLSGFSERWEIKKLGMVLKIKHGKSQKEVSEENGKYPILATSGEIGRAREYLYKKPSVLIGRKGTINKPQFMEEPFWAIDTLFYSEIFDDTDPKFVFYKFLGINWVSYNEASGVPSLNSSTIEKIEQSFPKCKEEQLAISQILSDLDSEIKELERLREKYLFLKNGMMHKLLTGEVRVK